MRKKTRIAGMCLCVTLSVASLSGCGKPKSIEDAMAAGEANMETSLEDSGDSSDSGEVSDDSGDTDSGLVLDLGDGSSDESVAETVNEGPKKEHKGAVIAKEETIANDKEAWIPPKTELGRWQKGKNGTWSFLLNGEGENSVPTLATGTCVEIDGEKYYFDNDGNLTRNGWVLTDKGYIYLKDNEIQTGWVTASGKKYYMDEEGLLASGKTEVDGQVYLFDNDGNTITGWKQEGTDWYYGESGKIVTGEKEIDGVKYAFGDDGKMMADTWYNAAFYHEDGHMFCEVENRADMTDAQLKQFDKLIVELPDKLVRKYFESGFKLIYNKEDINELEEISAGDAVSFKGKYMKFHNVNTLYHRFGHFIDYDNNMISNTMPKDLRDSEFELLGIDEYYDKNNFEYFAEACGEVLQGKEIKAEKTLEFVRQSIEKYK